ncbi:DUF3159 domain-containing protein [Bifidobacterium choloepi]|uniref:DUF3159 domain-containing protein n=1 Tax=Bifidobacterium choloepi TaxID=2614131 RepID=A0A6I5NFI6_9BIFI|nr:DUF3159 domain-containing protein [Bifidobacterium choloepi]NEG70104.1 DUF3159 domain-containing protein [Bifidobacterium choloepi]
MATNSTTKPNAGKPGRTGIQALADAGDDDFSVIQAIGGVRGVVESMIPGVLFIVLFLVTGDLTLTIVVSAAWALLQVVVRLCQRQSTMGAVSGLLAVAICLIWAWRSGEARNYYTFGFITNAAYAAVLLVTVICRVPGLGVVVEFVRSMPTSHFRRWLDNWRGDRALYRAYVEITWLWIALFCVRLVVQLPLYSSDHVGWLGTARLLMGIPLWALCIWISYLVVATPLHRHRLAEKRAAEQEGAELELEAIEGEESSGSSRNFPATESSESSMTTGLSEHAQPSETPQATPAGRK